MFTKSQFNLTKFNCHDRDGGAYSTLRSEYGLYPSILSAHAPIRDVSINAKSELAISPVALRFPATRVGMTSEFGLLGELGARVPIGEACVSSESELETAILKLFESEYINLTNFNLITGHTLIIDTDTLEVFIDGENALDTWVVGSSFFELKRGDNVIEFGVAHFQGLEVTVIWADRYL